MNHWRHPVSSTMGLLDIPECVVLENVALDAVLDPAGRAVAATSARRIAANLAVDPGTVARALTHLRAEGLIEHSRSQGTDGRFGLSAYLLAPIPGIDLSAPPTLRPRRPGTTTSGEATHGINVKAGVQDPRRPGSPARLTHHEQPSSPTRSLATCSTIRTCLAATAASVAPLSTRAPDAHDPRSHRHVPPGWHPARGRWVGAEHHAVARRRVPHLLGGPRHRRVLPRRPRGAGRVAGPVGGRAGPGGVVEADDLHGWTVQGSPSGTPCAADGSSSQRAVGCAGTGYRVGTARRGFPLGIPVGVRLLARDAERRGGQHDSATPERVADDLYQRVPPTATQVTRQAVAPAGSGALILVWDTCVVVERDRAVVLKALCDVSRYRAVERTC